MPKFPILKLLLLFAFLNDKNLQSELSTPCFPQRRGGKKKMYSVVSQVSISYGRFNHVENISELGVSAGQIRKTASLIPVKWGWQRNTIRCNTQLLLSATPRLDYLKSSPSLRSQHRPAGEELTSALLVSEQVMLIKAKGGVRRAGRCFISPACLH